MSSATCAENLDELLVTLLVKYRPHLQTHSHRMKSWQNLLDEFNSLSGLNYRQTRTLKRRFEKLRSVYARFGNVNVTNVDIFKQLVSQFEFERQKSGDWHLSGPSPRRMANDEEDEEDERELILKVNKQSPQLGILVDTDRLESAQVMLEDSENEAPLDSITVLPHTHMKQLQKSRFGSLEETIGNAASETSQVGSPGTYSSGQHKLADVDLRQEILTLATHMEAKHQEDLKFRQQVMYKLDYIISMLQSK